MKDIGIIGSSDGSTAVFVSSKDENFLKSGGIVPYDMIEVNKEESQIVEVQTLTVEEKLEAKTLGENLNSGFKIMGLGMVAVFGVLTALYIVVKIMGIFAKTNKDKDSSNEKN